MYIEGVVLLIFPRGEGPFFQKWMRSTFCDFTASFSASEIHMVGDGDMTLWPPPPPRDSIKKINLSMIRVNNRQQTKKDMIYLFKYHDVCTVHMMYYSHIICFLKITIYSCLLQLSLQKSMHFSSLMLLPSITLQWSQPHCVNLYKTDTHFDRNRAKKHHRTKKHSN